MKQFFEVLTKNRKVQALAVLLVAIAAMDVAFYFLRTAPAVARESSLEERVEGLRGQIRDAEKEGALYGSYENGRKQIGEFKALLPRRSEYVQVLDRIYRMAKEDGMKSTSMTTNVKEAASGDLVQLKFTMPVSGNYRSARKFINDIESSAMFLSIDNLSLSTTPDGDINFTLALSTYMRS